MVELLAPAGSYESLRAAVNAGADAVYIGGSLFGARAYADNPDEEHLIRGIEYCHLHGRKLYMTVNTLLKEKEIETMLYDYLRPYYENGVDGLIVQDLGVVRFVQEHFPGLPIHASTQMTVTGADGARLLGEQGITRIVPARELSLEEISRIIRETGIEVETFIHGAMCYSYSGQCLFSSLLGGRSGNRGRCAQPCRLPYSIADKGRAGKEAVSCLLSMKDMCTLDLLPDLIDAGIASMKIEGRMKKPEYTAGVVSVYRKYIDLYQNAGRRGYRIAEDDRRILMDLYNRGGFSKGYYRVHNGREMMAMKRPNHQGTEAAKIKSAGKGKARGIALEALHKQDVLELAPGAEITLANDVRKGESFTLPTGKFHAEAGSIVYRTRNEQLLKRLNEAFVVKNYKEKIKGSLRIPQDSSAILKLQYGDIKVAVSGEIAEPASNSPTSEEKVRKQMEKTGNTPFEFEQLDIWMDDGVFTHIGRLNELRRMGLAKLQEEILSKARERNAVSGAEGSVLSDFAGGQPIYDRENRGQMGRFNVLVTSWEQFEAVLEAGESAKLASDTGDFNGFSLDTVYLDSLLFGSLKGLPAAYEEIRAMIWKAKDFGWSCFLNCPPVFRDLDRALLLEEWMQALMGQMDGFLIHTVDELAFLKDFLGKNKKDAVLAADDNFYTYNRRAAAFLREQGVSRITFPAELNFRELQSVAASGTELVVYGYQPLMQSAQCVLKNTRGCSHTPSVTYLQDRKKAKFPVLNRCPVCCNTIYNSVPLQLADCRKEIKQLAPDFIRLSFTVESGEETRRILKRYYNVFQFGSAGRMDTLEPDKEGTRGHFRRGVE